MKMGQEFEKIVLKAFLQELERKWPFENFTVHHRQLFQGKSGLRHEIDIAISYEIAGSKHFIAIECKDHSRKVGKNIVSDFINRISEIKASKGIIVSNKGFQNGAIELAKYNNIALATIVNYTYTPCIGDPFMPEYFKEKLKDIFRRDFESVDNNFIENVFDSCDFSCGKLASEPKIRKFRKDIRYCELHGFTLNTDSDKLLIDFYDFFKVLICLVIIENENIKTK